MTDTAWTRAIIHMDLDAFYASVEQLRSPALRGQPVVVGGGRDASGNAVLTRGVVSAASYEARKFGVRSGMPLITAVRQCPKVVVLPVDFVAYRAASRAVFEISHEVTPQIEPASLDEAYLDVTGSLRRFGPPDVIAVWLRDTILERVGLHTSFGVATNKTVAKIGSGARKPRGLVVVPPGAERQFLAPLPLRALPGLGPASEKVLQGLGITTLGELAALPLDVVIRRAGEHAGRSLWERARGLDASPVTIPTVPKSVSREETFDVDVRSAADLHQRVRELAADVGRRLRADQLAGRVIALKLRYEDFSTLSRQVSLPDATCTDSVITRAAQSLLDAAWNGRPVRLLGVGVSGILEQPQLDLFGPDARDALVDQTIDSLRERFGDTAVQRGAEHRLQDLDFRGDDLRTLHPENYSETSSK